MTMIVFFALVIVSSFSICVCFQKSPLNCRLQSALYSNKIDQDKSRFTKSVISTLASLSLAWASNDSGVIADQGPTKVLGLETSISNLEKSATRADTVQSLADLYEAAGAKTLLARTKYKYRIIKTINDKKIQLSDSWDQALSYETGEVKRRVDPFRTVDLGPYLSIAPFVGGACYLAALFVQQALPELFVFAYPLAAFAFISPIAFIIIFG